MEINNEKILDPLWIPFAPYFRGGGGSSAASPPYLKTLFEQKNRKFVILTIFACIIPFKVSLRL